MNTFSTSVAALAAVLLADTAVADRYVSRDLDYGSGAGGAVQPGDLVYSTLQAAVAAAAAGDTVWVKDGFVCDTGATMYGMSNRVHITKALTIRSQSGTWEGGAAIVGAPDPATGGNGDYATRCVNVTATGVTLIGLRLENGYVKSGTSGGGLFSQTTGGRLENCRVEGCKGTAVIASQYAAVNRYIEVVDCLVTNNASGLAYCVATGSVIAGNKVTSGTAGASHCILNDCQIVGNVASNDNTTSMCRGGGASLCSLTNCVLAGNVVYSGKSTGDYARGGGAWSCQDVVGCLVSNNYAKGYGGGLSSCVFLSGCTFVGNNGSNGGGAEITTAATVENCTFRGNHARNEGGGLYADCGTAPVKVSHSDFVGNRSDTLGGGLRYYSNSSRSTPGEITDCTIAGNTAATGGGGLYGSSRSVLFVRNCTVVSNTLTASSQGGGGMINAYAEDTLVEGNRILARTNGSGGGTRDCTLYRCLVKDNDSCGATGGCSGGSLTNCVVCGNIATNADLNAWAGNIGGVGSAVAVGCVITNNYANWRGGGTYGGTYYSCLIAHNTLYGTGNSGGAACWEGRYYNCTIVDNAVAKGPGGFGSCAAVVNTISWGNRSANNAADFATCATNICVAKHTATSLDSGVISSDPLFRATSGEQAYHISGRSPCRKAGAVLEWLSDPRSPCALDLAGRSLAPEGAAPDMGCYAFDSIGFRLLVR